MPSMDQLNSTITMDLPPKKCCQRNSRNHYTFTIMYFVFLSICVATVNSQTQLFTHNGRKFAGVLGNYSGDYLLGGLFSAHDYNHETKSCGRIQEQTGIQMIEAMYFTLDEINSSGFFNGFTLGALMADTCDTATVGLERSVEFVRDLTESLSFPNQLPLQCRDGSTPTRVSGSGFNRVLGVVGAMSSSVSTQVASFLRLFEVPQISYLSTTPDLSNKERYGYFLRTVPSDSFQALAIIEILRRFKWSYVSAVYDDSNYGSEGFGVIEKLATQYGICFAVTRKIRRYPSSPDDDQEAAMDDVVADLADKRNARAVVVFTTFLQARRLFLAVSRNPRAHGLIWVGSDGWSGHESVPKGIEQIVQNSITVQPLGTILPGFDQYFTRLKPSVNVRNPWFGEFWASHFKCHWGNSPEEWIKAHPDPCQEENQEPSTETGYFQLHVLMHVRNAVYAYAHAIRSMHEDRCGNVSGICDAMAVSNIAGSDLLSYLRNVTFIEGSGLQFSFLNGVDGPPRYSILSYRKVGPKYRWLDIGNYSYENERGKMIFYDHVTTDFSPSYCSPPCAPYQATKTLETDKCCWVCVNCTYYQYRPTEDQCTECPPGFLPNAAFNACASIAEVYVAHGKPLSIGLSFFALFGTILSIIIGIIFFRHRNTPIIKASGKEVSFVLLTGVALSFSSTIVFVAEPTKISCGFTRFLFGTCYTICYAAILTKTNRIARIFHGGQAGALKTKFIDAKWQMLFVGVLTSIEVLILIVWCILKPPDIDHLYPTRRDNIRICSESDKVSYLIGLIYPFLLVVLCTFYAIKTRKTPDGFNETRYIAFCVYSTCILWLSFIPIYFANSDHTLRVVTLSVSLSANSTVTLASIFLPKIYIVLFRPKKNTKEAVMTNRAAQRSHEERSNGHKSEAGSLDDKEQDKSGKDISVISRSEMRPGKPLDSLSSPEGLADADLQNQSNDSGCYVNNAFRDSSMFLDEGIAIDNIDVGLKVNSSENNGVRMQTVTHSPR